MKMLDDLVPMCGLIGVGVGAFLLFGVAWAVLVVGGLLWLDGYLPDGRR